jgi:hypothetical protein
VLPGVVCKRNLARKNMSGLLGGPLRVALISGGIDSSKSLPDGGAVSGAHGHNGASLLTLENVSYEHVSAASI